MIGGLLALAMTAALDAQWVNYRNPSTPLTRDGKPDLSAPTPKAADGKPDLSGVWRILPTPIEELTRLFGPDIASGGALGDDPATFSKYVFSVTADFKPEDDPVRPEGAAILKRRLPDLSKDIPTTHCLPAGIPLAMVLPIPFKIVQTRGLTLMLFEGDGTVRQIYTDGRKHPADPFPLWLGYSVGKWEGDTFVVDTTGFNDKSWLDGGGHPHSDALHVVERFRRRDFGHLDVQFTIDDPKMYTKPFTIAFTEILQPDTDYLESFCAENEKDRTHLVGQ
jgi:hypothetical protein